jgi:hypothetical protein
MVRVYINKKVIKSETKGNHRNKVLDFEKLTEINILYFYISPMFTLIYYIIIQDARNVGLRICSSSSDWWKYPWSKSRIKNASRNASQKKPVDICLSRALCEPGTSACLSWRWATEDKRRALHNVRLDRIFKDFVYFLFNFVSIDTYIYIFRYR